MAIRVALGASRWRVIRQLLIESVLLAAGGAALGCLFAYGGTKAIAALIPEGTIPREAVIRLNVPVLAFSLLVAMVTTLLFGLVPALQTARRDMVEPLKDAGKGVSGGFRRGKLRSVLVVVEVALSLVLLVGAGLLMRSFVALQTVDLGLDPENILVARVPAATRPVHDRRRKAAVSSERSSIGSTRCPESWSQPRPRRCRPTVELAPTSRFLGRHTQRNGELFSSCAARATSRRWACA